MQTLQNVGSLTAALGPMAGGYGYAGATPSYNTSYTPAGGSISTLPPPGTPGAGGGAGAGAGGGAGGGINQPWGGGGPGGRTSWGGGIPSIYNQQR